MDCKQQQLEANIGSIKEQLTALGRLRPGSLSKQARARGGTYLQITCTCRGKTRCEYVRAEYEPVIRSEIETYRRCREMIRQWMELELQLSRLNQQAAARTDTGSPGGRPPPAT